MISTFTLWVRLYSISNRAQSERPFAYARRPTLKSGRNRIYNLFIPRYKKGKRIPDCKSFAIVDLFLRNPKRYKLNAKKDMVTYVGDRLEPAEAIDALEDYLVEGTFIYFFAKFGQDAQYKIKYQYYAVNFFFNLLLN